MNKQFNESNMLEKNTSDVNYIDRLVAASLLNKALNLRCSISWTEILGKYRQGKYRRRTFSEKKN